MKYLVGIWFIIFCCSFGTGLLIFDSIKRTEKAVSATASRPSGCEYEVWTDDSSGHRFLVVTRKWNIGGVGVCLIPEREEENDCPAPALAEKVTLESTAGWKEIR